MTLTRSVHPPQLCIELDTKSSAQAAVGLDETIAPRRVIKVCSLNHTNL